MADATSPVAPVSTAPGLWSILLAAGAPTIDLVISMASLVFATTQGTLADPRFAVAIELGLTLSKTLAVGAAITAVIVGITALVYAYRSTGRPGRRQATILGWVGVGLGLLMIPYVLWAYSPGVAFALVGLVHVVGFAVLATILIRRFGRRANTQDQQSPSSASAGG